jgi:4'-phosphopantetheinyl transferase
MIYWHLCPARDCAQPGAVDRYALSAAGPDVLTAVDPAAFGVVDPDFLSASERKTYAGLRFPKRRHEWLLGRWTAKQLLQRSLERYRGLPLPAISVSADPDGAPYLSVDGEGRLPASLSISHRSGRAFCALSPGVSPSIGVDIERIEPRAAAFVNDFFTEGEAARVWASPESSRDTLVTVIWSAKEAVLKALREGLRMDTRAVEIGHVPGLEVPLLPTTTVRPQPHLSKRHVGDAATVGERWRPITVACDAPGVLRFAAWWCPDGDSVLTMAAAWP